MASRRGDGALKCELPYFASDLFESTCIVGGEGVWFILECLFFLPLVQLLHVGFVCDLNEPVFKAETIDEFLGALYQLSVIVSNGNRIESL